MLLCTKGQVEVITLYLGLDILFSIHEALVRYGQVGVKQLSDRCRSSYALYSDKLRFVIGRKVLPLYMNYATGQVVG